MRKKDKAYLLDMSERNEIPANVEAMIDEYMEAKDYHAVCAYYSGLNDFLLDWVNTIGFSELEAIEMLRGKEFLTIPDFGIIRFWEGEPTKEELDALATDPVQRLQAMVFRDTNGTTLWLPDIPCDEPLLKQLLEKYETSGSSVTGAPDDIIEELKNTL